MSKKENIKKELEVVKRKSSRIKTEFKKKKKNIKNKRRKSPRRQTVTNMKEKMQKRSEGNRQQSVPFPLTPSDKKS